MQKTMKRPYQIAGVVIMLFSAFIVRESLQMRYYTLLGPGPGFFPFWAAVATFLLAANMFFQATLRRSEPMPGDFWASKTGYLRALAVIVSFMWVVHTMERLGFRLSMAVFLLWLLVTLGRVAWHWSALITALGSWGAFWLFNDLLGVIMPLGPWGF